MIINILLSIVNFFFLGYFYKNYLHFFQLKDYNNARYLSYFKNKIYFIFLINFIALFLLIFIKNNILNLIIYLILILINNYFHKKIINNKKTPLKYTKKIIRLYIISIIILVLLIFAPYSVVLSNLTITILPILSNLINIYDRIKNRHYILSAQKKLKSLKTQVIAITGSNGKTSVKNILLKLLSTQYNVQATPKSYNTPLGISTFINNDLSTDCDYLILEYGARRCGDIKKLCKVFGADYGIITLVAPQHLATFKTLENIYQTKKELSDYLNNKLCIYNLDNIYTYRMYQNKFGSKLGISINTKHDIFANNIKIKNFKTYFDLHIDNNQWQLNTNLLGRHNVTNILLSIALAQEIGVKIDNIINTISQLSPTSHRLEYIKGYINILDDSYNCSLASAEESIIVLYSTPNKKMIATPGIIEGGKDEYLINYKLGKLCSHADYVIIIGEHNKDAIISGLRDSPATILVDKTLEDAKKHFHLLKPNDTLLILNDLPDDYI